MKGDRAVDPAIIPGEAESLGKIRVAWLTKLFSKILEGERIPDEWKKKKY